MAAKETGEPGWKWRRAAIFPVIAYACWMLFLLRGDADTEVNKLMASGFLWLIAALLFCYTGFATIQDVIAIWKTGTGLPYAKPPVAVDGEPAQ